MHRRRFLAASLATAAAASASVPAAQGREFYLLRRYSFQNGPQTKRAESYFADALIPALNRAGLRPVGAFRLEYGPRTPCFYLLIPAASVEPLALLDLRLAEDAVFTKAAEPFWAAPAQAASYLRVDSSLFAAFTGWPRLTVPKGAEQSRIYQLRTYESPSDAAHVRKVEMFNHGEFAIFQNAGAEPVFFGDTLVGEGLPSLTYMLAFPSMEAMVAHWKRFPEDPAWKALSTNPRYAYEEIVSNITNLVLSPLVCSQI